MKLWYVFSARLLVIALLASAVSAAQHMRIWRVLSLRRWRYRFLMWQSKRIRNADDFSRFLKKLRKYGY